MTAKLQAWDRRAIETAEAFEAFALYRDAGSGRTIEAVSEALSKHYAQLAKWSARHEWVARAAAYDTEVARRASAKAIESDADALARQIEDARAIQADARARFVEAATDASDMSRAEAARVWAMAAKEEREARRLPAKVEASGTFVFRVSHEDEDVDDDADKPVE